VLNDQKSLGSTKWCIKSLQSDKNLRNLYLEHVEGNPGFPNLIYNAVPTLKLLKRGAYGLTLVNYLASGKVLPTE
jgi:hypothetical protein